MIRKLRRKFLVIAMLALLGTLAFLVAAVVTVGAGFGLWSYYRFAITGWMIVALIALIFLVAFSAMFGYDKLVQLMEQAGWIKAQK